MDGATDSADYGHGRILDLGAGTGVLSSALAERIGAAQVHLLDAYADMLDQAVARPALGRCEIYVQNLVEDLPRGPFDGLVSALAIHLLADKHKRDLYARILEILSPGGLFVNAEQVSGGSRRLQSHFEDTHLGRARDLGSSEAEIQGALERMRYDRCATLSDQLGWLDEVGFEDAECFFRSFRFAVFGGWKPALCPGV
jgi:tRNA (cmo5U34)-methyltransferase